MKRKKLRNRLARRVLSGKISVDEARRRLGRDIAQKSAVPSLAKAEPARAGLTAEAVREAILAGFRSARPVTGQDVLDAARPLTRPPVTKATVPAGATPAQILKAVRSYQPAEVPARPARPWTSAELNMLREAEKISDPGTRERTLASLYAGRERMA